MDPQIRKKTIKLNEALLALYMLIMCVSSIYLYVTHNKPVLLLIIAVLAVILYFLSCLILKTVRGISLSCASQEKNTVIPFAVFTILAFAVLMIWYIAFRPGSFEDDNIAQLGQALTGEYDNWHPVWHTLLFYKLPLIITGSTGSIVPFQMLWFSLAVGYMCAVLYRYFGRIFSVIAFAYAVFNPITGYILLFPFKDVAFAITGMLACTMAMQIRFSDGAWADKWYKCVLLGLILASGTIFRHNGILFTGMLLIALFFNMDKCKWGITAICFAGFMILIQGPLYKALNVNDSGTEVIQVVGFPMSIIGNVARETPELMDEETAEFVYSIAPAETWETVYQRGNFNLMKYGGAENTQVIEDTGAADIVRMAARCTLRSPQAALDSFFSLTDFVYGFDIRDKADIDIFTNNIIENDYGIEHRGNDSIASLLGKYASAAKLHGWNFVRKLGFINLVIVILVLAGLRWSHAEDWKRILMLLPVLAYDFGTMFLLSGHDARFFYIAFTVFPIMIGLGIYDAGRK